MMISANVEYITPANAKEILSGNIKNRKIRDRDVRKIADDITRGLWRLNGETIKLDRDGVVVDGQHRLLAIVKAGKAVPVLVVRGVSVAEDRPTIDCGSRRRAADFLDVKYSVQVIAVLRLMEFMENGFGSVDTMSNAQLQKLATSEMFSELPEACRIGMHVKGKMPLPTAGLCCAVWVLGKHCDPVVLAEFLNKFHTGEMCDKHSPELALRAYLDRKVHRQGNSRKMATMAFNAIVYAFLKKWQGEKVMCLRPPADGYSWPDEAVDFALELSGDVIVPKKGVALP